MTSKSATEPTPNLTPAKRSKRRVQQKDWAPYVFMAPTLIFFVVFFLLPIGFSLYLTFTRWNPLSTPKWIGLDNFVYLFNDATFLASLRHTLEFAFGTVLIGVPLALVLAFLFTQSRYRAFWRSLYFLPMITNVAAIGFLWQFILDGNGGLINRFLGFVGIAGPDWLSDPSVAMWAVIIVAIWYSLGQNMILFSAGLEGIDDSFYNAASVDGANTWQTFWHVTLPLVRPTLLFVSITSFISAMGASFALILVLTGGGPVQSTNVTALYMYQMAFTDLRMGRASAAAFILFVIIFIITLIQLRVFRRGGVEAY